MSSVGIFEQVVEVVGRYAKDADALKAVTMETNILKDLKVNSTRLVDVILEFEDRFKLQISDEDADHINTVGDAVKLLERLIN